MILSGMYGLGDNLYQRAIVRTLPDVSLITPWPQLYADLPNVKCIRPVTHLRTQVKNMMRQDLQFATRGPSGAVKPFGYSRGGTIVESMLKSINLTRRKLDFSGPPVATACYEPYVLVRPATVRAEWRADARNPDPRYIAAAVDALRDKYTIISVADLKPGAEWPVGDLPYADVRYHNGELSLEYLLALVSGASGVISGVGWALPACVAYQTPLLLIYGGWGADNGPQRVLDSRMPIKRIIQAVPDKFCMCSDRHHDCDKRITRIDEYIAAFGRLAETNMA